MKRSVLPFAIAGLFTSTAGAQSSVTVFGVMDLAARSVSNESRGSIQSLVSGSNATSRLAFRGTEDLGAGLSAGFHLEHGIALDTGSPASATQFWDRRATVSLSGSSLGELRLGRDFTPTYVNWGRYDPFNYVGVASASNFISATPAGPIRSAFAANPNTTVRSSKRGAVPPARRAGWAGRRPDGGRRRGRHGSERLGQGHLGTARLCRGAVRHFSGHRHVGE